MSRGSHFAALVAGAALALAAPAGAAAAKPVPSLQPKATAKLWHRLVQQRHTAARKADCMRLVFYAATDWLRLATKLAAQPGARARSTTSRSRRSPPTRRPSALTSRGASARSGRTSTPSRRSATTAGARGSPRTAAPGTRRASKRAGGWPRKASTSPRETRGRERILVGRAHRHGRCAPEPPRPRPRALRRGRRRAAGQGCRVRRRRRPVGFEPLDVQGHAPALVRGRGVLDRHERVRERLVAGGLRRHPQLRGPRRIRNDAA